MTFRDATLDRLVTHRVVDDGDDGTWRTRGDAHGVEDPVPLTTVPGTTHTDRSVLGGSRTYHCRVTTLRHGWSSGPSTTAAATTPLLCL